MAFSTTLRPPQANDVMPRINLVPTQMSVRFSGDWLQRRSRRPLSDKMGQPWGQNGGPRVRDGQGRLNGAQGVIVKAWSSEECL